MPLSPRKKILTFSFTVLLLATLIFLMDELQKRQLYQKRAEESPYVDEVTTAIGDPNLQFVKGALVSLAEAERMLKGEATKATVVIPQGEESRLTLPSVTGFTSSLYTGTAEVSYPLATFPGKGGLVPAVSLNYSSGATDDMHLYRSISDEYATQAGITGLGWEMGGLSYIARDNTTYPNSFHLVFPGGTTKLFLVDEQTPIWQSNPKLFIRVRHLVNNHHIYYDTNTWTITTQDGTQYIFGSQISTDGQPNPQTEAATPLTVGKHIESDQCLYNRLFPYKWYLRKVIDVNGNTIEYEYTHFGEKAAYNLACSQADFIPYTYLTKIKYNNVNGEYRTFIEFDYETRPDSDTTDYVRYRREICETQSRRDCNPGGIQYRVSTRRLKEIRVLVKIQTDKPPNLTRKYVLSYEQGQGRGTIEEVNFHPGHSLLKEIRLFGADGQQSLPPYIFVYSGSLNEVYLTSAKNGYGGKVSYEYIKHKVPFCTSEKDCRSDGEFGAVRNAVTRIITEDGEGNSFQKTYAYESPKAYVKTQIDSRVVDACNRCKDGCQGACESACRNRCGTDNACLNQCLNDFVPGCTNDCKNQCTGGQGDFCGDSAPFTGYEFLGFGKVKETLYALNDSGRVESSSRAYFHQSLEKEGCFEPDPRQGRAFKTETLATDGSVLTAVENFYEPNRAADSCRSDKKLWEKESVFVKLTQINNLQFGSVGSKVTAIRTDYDPNYGLVNKVENLGDTDVPGDEKYSFINYIANPELGIVKQKETWVSDSPSGDKYNHTYYYYDGNDRYYPTPSKPLTKGLLTRISAEDDKSYPQIKRIITNFEYYDNGQLKKTIDPLNYVSETIYDDGIGVFPVVVRNPLGQVSRSQYFGRDYLLGTPTFTIDLAGKRTRMEYDTFGRLRKIFNPDSARPTQPEAAESVSYEYFDQERKSYVRIRTKVFENNYQVTDQIYNGWGELLQGQVLLTLIDEDQTGNKQEKGLITQFKYNSRGQKIEETLPVVAAPRSPAGPPLPMSVSSEEKTVTHYDQLGRVVSVIDPLGRVTRTSFKDFETVVVDPAGQRTMVTTDGLGRQIFATSYQGDFGASSGKRIDLNTSYDVLDNPVSIRQSFPDAAEMGVIPMITTSYVYDLLGRKTEVNDPDLGKWTFEYDNKGQIRTQTDAKGQKLTFEYDSLGRLTKKIYPRKPYPQALSDYIEYKYDYFNGDRNNTTAIGQRWQMNDLTGKSQWEYDAKGRVIKLTKTVSGNITGGNDETAVYEYIYYPTDQIKTYKYPDGEILSYSYDKFGNQIAITGQEQYLTDVSFNKFGSSTKTSLGHNFVQKFAYDQINRLRSLATTGGERLLFQANYTYDRLDNIADLTNITPTGEREIFHYTYDSFSQLKNVAGTFDANYHYNEAGNMLSKDEGERREMRYDSALPVHAPKEVNGAAYRYDPNGNLLEDEARIYEWDFDNKPIKIRMKNTGEEVLFFYDGDGERVAKKEVTP